MFISNSQKSMRITDNNISELIMDRNAVHMEYVGAEKVQCDCFFQILYNFELTTSFFGDDSKKVAQQLNEHPSYLHIRHHNFRPMADVKCTLFDINSTNYANGKITFRLRCTRYYTFHEDAERDAETISGKRFKLIDVIFEGHLSHDLVMVEVNEKESNV